MRVSRAIYGFLFLSLFGLVNVAQGVQKPFESSIWKMGIGLGGAFFNLSSTSITSIPTSYFVSYERIFFDKLYLQSEITFSEAPLERRGSLEPFGIDKAFKKPLDTSGGMLMRMNSVLNLGWVVLTQTSSYPLIAAVGYRANVLLTVSPLHPIIGTQILYDQIPVGFMGFVSLANGLVLEYGLQGHLGFAKVIFGTDTRLGDLGMMHGWQGFMGVRLYPRASQSFFFGRIVMGLDRFKGVDAQVTLREDNVGAGTFWDDGKIVAVHLPASSLAYVGLHVGIGF